MKKVVYIWTMLLLVTLVFQSCEDLEAVDTPDFSVVFNTTAKVGEPVEFTITDAPNFLNFYSGEYGHEFKNSERYKADGEFFLNFDTARNYFDGASKNDEAWSFLVSTDYTGSGTIEDVKVATWTDISDRFTFATARSYNLTNSGSVNITEFASDLPTYFAIRAYAEGKKEDGNRQGVFRVHSFDIALAVANENYSLDITNFTNPGFNSVNVEGVHPTNSTKDYWRNRGSYYELSADQAEYTNDDWLITNPVNLAGAVDPDRGEPLKTFSDRLKSFQYTFAQPGTYTVTFVGSNETIYGQKGSIKEYTITVSE
ncbi:DUF5017 domain-containing protein [Gelidibacter salicanalis]|uniref:DUF5017 domain-containing protein n=1 Tax=Gelidibacter salicanalis TaxID=291193 RepID=A0A934KVY4_9FLAO|nr:DUF5017 domain-containing protein [Gelidibacter salicanalis]MBJ7882995.1 DUF5017 domain-containing protein [Gelidibacter salicanalis]